MRRVRVLLADDHTLVRAGIRSLLETIEGVEVIAETDDGREALDLLAALLATRCPTCFANVAPEWVDLLERCWRKPS